MDNANSRANKTPDTETADRIMHAMIVKGITLKALERSTGISYTTLRRSLHQHRPDRRSLTVQELGNIANALNVQPSALMPAEFTKAAA